jgi:nitric oxide reductase subunit B
MEVQDQLAMFYWVRLGSGVFVVISAIMFVWAVLLPGRKKHPAISAAMQPAE